MEVLVVGLVLLVFLELGAQETLLAHHQVKEAMVGIMQQVLQTMELVVAVVLLLLGLMALVQQVVTVELELPQVFQAHL
jgi:hypothetical protein